MSKEKKGVTGERRNGGEMRVGGSRGVEGGGVEKGEEAETEKEKDSTCGSHYSVGQDTVVVHGAFFCRGELVAKGRVKC